MQTVQKVFDLCKPSQFVPVSQAQTQPNESMEQLVAAYPDLTSLRRAAFVAATLPPPPRGSAGRGDERCVAALEGLVPSSPLWYRGQKPDRAWQFPRTGHLRGASSCHPRAVVRLCLYLRSRCLFLLRE